MSRQDYEQLMLFPADSPARPFPWLESKREKTMIVTSGRRCCELSTNCARAALSVRMYLESSRLPPGRWSRIWNVQAITSSCLILKLRLSELGTEDRGCSSSGSQMWPTPRANEYKDVLQSVPPSRMKDPGKCNLTQAVAMKKLFAKPCAADAQGSHGGNNHRSLRTDVAGQLNPTWVEWLMGFPIGWTDLNASEMR
nr:MAG TPA: hypothetical protein [Caudoviricetes sp.]